MAKNTKRRHGKVEARKIKPVIRFKLGILLLLIALAFGGCFALYMMSALSQEDYWEKEIVGSSQSQQETGGAEDMPVSETVPSAAVNPVPESAAAEESRMTACAFLGDVTEFTAYCETASGMVFTDAVSVLTEDSMNRTAEQLAAKSPQAVYLWYQCPEDPEAGIGTIRQFARILQTRLEGTPVYLLSALPAAEDAEQNRAVNSWNSQLFALADELELHYVDLSTALKGNDGSLSSAYTEPAAKYGKVRELILTHVAE